MKNLLLLIIAGLLLTPPAMAQGVQPQLDIMMTRYDPYPAEPGSYVNVWVKVQNEGASSAGNLTLELLDTYPFSIDPSEERMRSFGEVLPSEPVLVEYRVRVDNNAIEGRNPIDLKTSVNGRDFLIKSFDIYVESRNVDFAIGSLQSEPERMVSDTENNRLTLGLQNIGESAAKLVRAELTLPEGFTPSESYSDEYAVGNIEAESSADAVFYVDIGKDVAEGKHTATLKVYYKDGSDGDYKRKTLQVSIPVRTSPSFEVTGTEIAPQPLGQGMEGVTMKLDIKNTGSRKAENVNVRVLKEATQPFDFDEKSSFVGTLEPGESGQAVFGFDIDNSADLRKYIMDIEIRYTTDSTVNIASDRVSFEVTDPIHEMTGLYVMLIIFLAIAGVIVWYLKK